MGRKMARRLSWPISADFGHARDAQIGGKIADLGAKMEFRWCQDGPRFYEACLAILRPIRELSWASFEVLGEIFAQMADM